MDKEKENDKSNGWTTVSIPVELAREIDTYVVREKGYTSRADFIIDIIRRHLEKLTEEYSKKSEG